MRRESSTHSGGPGIMDDQPSVTTMPYRTDPAEEAAPYTNGTLRNGTAAHMHEHGAAVDLHGSLDDADRQTAGEESTRDRRHTWTVQARRTIVSLLLYPVYLLVGLARYAKLLPRKNVVVGSALGLAFNDNSKYFYLLMRDEPNVIWVTASRRLCRWMRRRGLRCELLWHPRGIAACLSARRFVISHRPYDVSPVFMMGAEVVHLYHAVPLKRVGRDSKWSHYEAPAPRIRGLIKSALSLTVYHIYPHLDPLYCDRLVYHSKPDDMLSAYRVRKGAVLPHGFPRLLGLDRAFVERNWNLLGNQTLTRIESIRRSGRRIVLYMPTHRSRTNMPAARSAEVGRWLEKIAADQSVQLVYKSHILDETPELPDGVINYTDPDPYPLLNLADLVVTDYSSIMYDFLLLDRPVVLFPYDFDTYQRVVGFYRDYFAHAPGSVAMNAENLYREVRAELDDPARSCKKRQRTLAEVFTPEIIEHRGVLPDRLKELVTG